MEPGKMGLWDFSVQSPEEPSLSPGGIKHQPGPILNKIFTSQQQNKKICEVKFIPFKGFLKKFYNIVYPFQSFGIGMFCFFETMMICMAMFVELSLYTYLSRIKSWQLYISHQNFYYFLVHEILTSGKHSISLYGKIFFTCAYCECPFFCFLFW